MSMLLQASRPTTGSAGRLQLFDLSVLALLAVGYLPVFALYARQQWTGNTLQGAYGHAWVALLLVAWMLWRQRGVLLRTDAMAGGRNAWIWLSVGVLLKLYGDYHSYDVLRGVSLVPTLAGLAMLRFGARGWRELRFPVLFLLFVIPLPDAAIDAVTRPLIDATSIAVRGLLPWLGLDIGGAGPYLLLGDLRAMAGAAKIVFRQQIKAHGILFITQDHGLALRNITAQFCFITELKDF